MLLGFDGLLVDEVIFDDAGRPGVWVQDNQQRPRRTALRLARDHLVDANDLSGVLGDEINAPVAKPPAAIG